MAAHRRYAMRPEDARINATVSQVRGTDLTVRMGSAKAGVATFGAVGGSPMSAHNILARAMLPALAQELGMSEEAVWRVVAAYGREAQKRLLNGTPIGIPFLAVIALGDHRTDVDKEIATVRAKADAQERGERMIRTLGKNPDALARGTAALRAWVPPARRRYLTVKSSLLMRRFIQDNATHTGSWREHLRDIQHADRQARGLPPTNHHRRTTLAQVGIDKTGAVQKHQRYWFRPDEETPKKRKSP